MGNDPYVCITVSRCLANEYTKMFFRVKNCTFNTTDVF